MKAALVLSLTCGEMKVWEEEATRLKATSRLVYNMCMNLVMMVKGLLDWG